MNSLHLTIKLYKLLLQVYPSDFRSEFEEEMQAVFEETVARASRQGTIALIVKVLNEFFSAPAVLLRLHYQNLQKKVKEWAGAVVRSFSPDEAPQSLPPDGRDSWPQAGLESLFFLIVGLILIVITYLPGAQPPAGWQREPEVISPIVFLLAGPGLLAGLALGMPRWAYPLGGVIFSYLFLTAYWSRFLIFLSVMTIMAVFVGVLWLRSLRFAAKLPWQVKRCKFSLDKDLLRLSFGGYGALPLMIVIAFDNARYNDRAPFLALSVLAMLIGALVYIRSRRPLTQGLALLLGETFAIGMAVFGHWMIASESISYAFSSIVWLAKLWAGASILLILPMLPGLIRPPAGIEMIK